VQCAVLAFEPPLTAPVWHAARFFAPGDQSVNQSRAPVTSALLCMMRAALRGGSCSGSAWVCEASLVLPLCNTRQGKSGRGRSNIGPGKAHGAAAEGRSTQQGDSGRAGVCRRQSPPMPGFVCACARVCVCAWVAGHGGAGEPWPRGACARARGSPAVGGYANSGYGDVLREGHAGQTRGRQGWRDTVRELERGVCSD
jgi:hypothetical protein